MNEKTHNKERADDKAERQQVKSTLLSSNTLMHALAVIALALFGWNLSKTYDLGTQVSSHTALLESLKDGQADIKSQVSAIYQFELNKTDQAFYMPVKIGTTTKTTSN